MNKIFLSVVIVFIFISYHLFYINYMIPRIIEKRALDYSIITYSEKRKRNVICKKVTSKDFHYLQYGNINTYNTK